MYVCMYVNRYIHMIIHEYQIISKKYEYVDIDSTIWATPAERVSAPLNCSFNQIKQKNVNTEDQPTYSRG